MFLGAGGKLNQAGPSLVFSYALCGMAAVAIYVHRWLPDVPQWITALVALGVLLAVNLVSVKLFGELEFWFSLVKWGRCCCWRCCCRGRSTVAVRARS